MYKACIFDMDGTIVNTLNSIAYFGNTALNKLGFAPIETEKYKLMVGNGAAVLIERMLSVYDAKTEQNIRALRKEYDTLYEGDPFYLTKPYKGIPELLLNLKAKGIKLAVLSNKPDNVTKFVAEKFFENTFNFVTGQIDSVPTKPDPTSLYNIINNFGLSKQDILFCGDSNVDVQTGVNAGVDVVGVLWGFRSKEELVSSGANFTVSTAEELYELAIGSSK